MKVWKSFKKMRKNTSNDIDLLATPLCIPLTLLACNDVIYTVMPFFELGTLQTALGSSEKERFTTKQKIGFIEDLKKIGEVLITAGYVHRDIRPTHLCLTKNWNWRRGDTEGRKRLIVLILVDLKWMVHLSQYPKKDHGVLITKPTWLETMAFQPPEVVLKRLYSPSRLHDE